MVEASIIIGGTVIASESFATYKEAREWATRWANDYDMGIPPCSITIEYKNV